MLLSEVFSLFRKKPPVDLIAKFWVVKGRGFFWLILPFEYGESFTKYSGGFFRAGTFVVCKRVFQVVKEFSLSGFFFVDRGFFGVGSISFLSKTVVFSLKMSIFFSATTVCPVLNEAGSEFETANFLPFHDMSGLPFCSPNKFAQFVLSLSSVKKSWIRLFPDESS